MQIQEIGDSGIVFSLKDESSYPDYYCPANIYVVNGNEHFFISDGYFGPEILKEVVNYLEKEFEKKQYVLFSSHWHWDHLRGNNFFDDATIISHQLTKKLIIKNNIDKSLVMGKYRQRKIVLPNLTFSKEYTEFENENITFFHSPGHSEDSSSCYDSKNKVLFAGDNIEYPFPYVTSSDLSTYISTLKKYLKYPIEFVIPSHGYVSDKKLIESNLRYLESLPEINPDMYTEEDKESFLSETIKNLTTIGEDFFVKDEFEKAKIYYEKIALINTEEKILPEESVKDLETKLKEIEEKLK
ncbi:MAG: MBL fold metallo-hydrolase [Candidatus Heimdallarchaeota archaeon]